MLKFTPLGSEFYTKQIEFELWNIKNKNPVQILSGTILTLNLLWNKYLNIFDYLNLL